MKADLLIKSRCIFDSLRDEPFGGFVAIKGNRITKVCRESSEVEKSFVGEDTKIYDFRDKTVMPGFHDSHTHLILAGMYRSYPDLGDARSEKESAEKLKTFYNGYMKTAEGKSEEWIYGFNWYHVYWERKELPVKETLDEIFPDKPVFLLNAEAHGAWVNSKALELAGITNGTPDPDGGKIMRNEGGEATGFLFESAVGLVAKFAYDFTPEQENRYLKKYMDFAAEYGITSLVDVRPYFGIELGSPENYQKFDEKHGLKIRIHTAGDLLGNMTKNVEEREQYSSDKLKANLLKQFVDGVIITHTAFLTEDYEDWPGNRGEPIENLDRLRECILKAHKLGFSVKLHAIGDAAIKFCLDSFEEAKQLYGDTGARHAIEHIEYAREEDIKRFGKIGIIPSVQPEHLGLIPKWDEEEYRVVLGTERGDKTWPFKSLLESAGVLAIGSDCPVVSNNPFYEINRAITRLHDDGLPKGGWNPTEKLSLPQVLKGYTYGSAYGVGREKEIGSLSEGMLADIAVLDCNIFDIPYEQIRKVGVEMTIMDGKMTYNREGVEEYEV